MLKNITSAMLVSLLKDLICLPHLTSLAIDIIDDSELLSDIYQLIFRLPALKYTKISIPADEQIELLPLSTNSTGSTLEHLDINYPCTLDEMTAILSYTPRLIRLRCTELSELNSDIKRETSIILPNLTHIVIQECHMSFDEFEIFIKKISSQLQVLRINTFEDEIYIDPDRWKRLILQHIPNLRKFYFSHHEDNINAFHSKRYHALLNRFTSSFWIKRQWIFEYQIDYSQTIYSIRPYRYIKT